MKKSLKILRIVLIVVLVLVVVVSVLVRFFADSALKAGIEKGGSSALKVNVAVDKVDLRILRGSLGLQDLVIDNPPGYKNENLLVMNDAFVAVKVGSLLGDTVRIREVRLDGLEMVIEQKGLTNNNLNDIMKGLPSKEPGEEPAEEPKSAEPSGKKLVIETLDISNVVVKVQLPGKSDPVSLKLKPIQMTDLGENKKMDMAVLARKVLVAIAEGVAEQGVGVFPDNIVSPLASELHRAGESSKALLKKGEELVEGLKGFLGGKKEEGGN